MLKIFKKFVAVMRDKPARAVKRNKTGQVFFRRRIRSGTGETLHLQRIVPLAGGGMRAYFHGPKSGIRAIDRNGVTRIVKQTRDKVWLA